MPHTISLGHRLDRSEIYGPGLRAVFWTQGCNLACKGCWNTQYWSKKGGDNIQVSTLLEELDLIDGIEGITLLGGEPLQQSEASLELIQGCKEKGLTVFLYTGYDPSEFDDTMQQCFDLSDIAVTGRFVQELRDTTLRWRGSRNQQVISYPTPTMNQCCKNKLKWNAIFFQMEKFEWSDMQKKTSYL